MLRRSLFVLLGVLALVLVVVVGAVAVALWRPDLVKGQIERLASAQLGLPVTIEGPLAVHPGRVTTVEVSGLRVAAPEWAQAPTLATVRQLRLGVDLGRWWQDGSLVVTELRLDQPQAALERDAQGRTSWPSGGGSQGETEGSGSGQGGPTLPEIHDLTITDGSVSYKDAVTGVEVATALATTAPQAGSARDFGGLRLDGQGRVRGDQVTFDLEVGSPVLLTQARCALPDQGRAAAGRYPFAARRRGARSPHPQGPEPGPRHGESGPDQAVSSAGPAGAERAAGSCHQGAVHQGRCGSLPLRTRSALG